VIQIYNVKFVLMLQTAVSVIMISIYHQVIVTQSTIVQLLVNMDLEIQMELEHVNVIFKLYLFIIIGFQNINLACDINN